MRETSATIIWKKFEDQYMTNNIENRLYLKNKLFWYEFFRGTSINNHLDKFNKIISYLRGLDTRIDDKDKAILLLNSNSKSYDYLTTTLIQGKEKVAYDLVSLAVLTNEKHLKKRGNPTRMRYSLGEEEIRKSDKSKIICHQFRKLKHVHRNQKYPNRTNGGRENICVVENANVVTTPKEEDFESMLLVTPDLKKNLIFLGVFNSIKYRVILESKNLKVFSDATVVMRGKNESNLYFLQECTVTGFASITTKDT
ncbi:hypothetical protein LguiB_004165 [Lonicera macranthoides]